ncbi:unnamed protein product, partial [Allacma fusca]
EFAQIGTGAASGYGTEEMAVSGNYKVGPQPPR